MQREANGHSPNTTTRVHVALSTTGFPPPVRVKLVVLAEAPTKALVPMRIHDGELILVGSQGEDITVNGAYYTDLICCCAFVISDSLSLLSFFAKFGNHDSELILWTKMRAVHVASIPVDSDAPYLT